MLRLANVQHRLFIAKQQCPRLPQGIISLFPDKLLQNNQLILLFNDERFKVEKERIEIFLIKKIIELDLIRVYNPRRMQSRRW